MDNVALLIWIALLLPAAIFLALPRLTPRGYFFGITVPPDFPQTESGREIRRGYALTVAVAFVLGLALGIIVPQAMPAAVFLPIFASTGAFFYARHHVKPFSTSARRLPAAEVGGGCGFDGKLNRKEYIQMPPPRIVPRNGAPMERKGNGHFAPGNPGGPGRPKEFGIEKEKFAEAMRQEIRNHRLAPERMAMMAAGLGKYSKTSAKFQHEVTMDMLAYAYGRPAVVSIVAANENNITFIKRVIGIDEDAV
jgi:hypothetical protein